MAAFDRFDFAVREAMPGRGAEALLALCEEDRLKPHLTECFAVAAWANEKLRPAQWAARLSHLAESLYRPGRIDLPRNFADVETLRSQAAGLRAWMDAVATAQQFWADPAVPIGLDDFWRVASECIDAASVQVRDDRPRRGPRDARLRGPPMGCGRAFRLWAERPRFPPQSVAKPALPRRRH